MGWVQFDTGWIGRFCVKVQVQSGLCRISAATPNTNSQIPSHADKPASHGSIMLTGPSRLGSAGTACASRAGWLITRRDDAI